MIEKMKKLRVDGIITDYPERVNSKVIYENQLNGIHSIGFNLQSGWQDSNLRPPRPKRGDDRATLHPENSEQI